MNRKEVLKQIISSAKATYPHDKEMQQVIIEEEKDAYDNLTELDFSGAEEIKKEITIENRDIFGSWEELYDYIKDEVESYKTIQGFQVDGLSDKLIEDWKEEAKDRFNESYSEQLRLLEAKKASHIKAEKIRAEINPIRKILIDLEDIIANECYNPNIQNYDYYGEMYDPGRQFRYPVTFTRSSGEPQKFSKVNEDIEGDELITGRYKFGSNELNIYKGLVKVLDYLKNHFNLELPEKKRS